MRKAELIKALEAIADDVELVIGDPDTGRFFEPCVDSRRIKQLWFIRTFNPYGPPQNEIMHEYFDEQRYAETALVDNAEAGWKPEPVEVKQCLNL